MAEQGGVMLTDEDLVTNVLTEHTGEPPWSAAVIAKRVLEALAAANRLIPEGAEVATVFGVRVDKTGVVLHPYDELPARIIARGHQYLTQMTKATITTPWREVQGDE